jgi:PAS domain S-box-containing protein
VLEGTSDEFADPRAWLSAIVESSEDAIIGKDTAGLIRSWNPAAERLFGYRAEEIVGRPIAALAPEDRLDELPGILARIERGERVEHFETVRRRKNGSLVPVSLTISPVRDGHGRIVGASKIARDVTEQRQARERQALLVAELNHRVKNTLATVQSIAYQTLRNCGTLAEFGSMFEARLLALSRAHSALSSANWGAISIKALIVSILEPFRDGQDAFELEGEPICLPPNLVLALALAIHELATNAVKYGALTVPEGNVKISWQSAHVVGGTQVDLEWREREGPTIQQPPRRHGFGSRLLERLVAHEVAGSSTLAFEPSGVRWHVRFVLPSKAD